MCYSNWLIKRFEKTSIKKLKQNRKHYVDSNFSTVKRYIIYWLTLELLVVLLIIGGIEKNPAPNLKSHRLLAHYGMRTYSRLF